VAQVAADELVYETTASAVQQKRKLRRHFRRFDIFFFLICTVVTLDTVGAVAANGAQGFTWLIFLGIFFLLPYALAISELGSAFPQEGGPYVWTRLAFGRPLAAVNSVIYWISNPIWVGGSLTIVSFAAIEEFFGTVDGPWKYAYAVAFIWFTIAAAIVSLQYGKWVPTAGGWARGVLVAFFAATVIAYAAIHGVHGFGGRPGRGDSVRRRRRPPGPGQVLGPVRHAGRDERVLRGGGDRADDRRVPDHRGEFQPVL
jgi:glutamate:GABA antiporter